MEQLKQFNRVLTEFLDALVDAFPSHAFLKTLAVSTKAVMSNNATLPMRTFVESLSPYADQVKAKNAKFFIDNAHAIPFMRELRINEIFHAADDDNKAVIWKYIRTLCILSKVI